MKCIELWHTDELFIITRLLKNLLFYYYYCFYSNDFIFIIVIILVFLLVLFIIFVIVLILLLLLLSILYAYGRPIMSRLYCHKWFSWTVGHYIFILSTFLSHNRFLKWKDILTLVDVLPWHLLTIIWFVKSFISRFFITNRIKSDYPG